MMKITYDPEVDALYIELRPAGPEGVETRETSEGIYLDFGPDGKLVGIEILDASALSGADLGRVVLELRPAANVPA
jgi:uncharacterized protein YuzE